MCSAPTSSAKYKVRVFARLRGPLFAVVENAQEHMSGSMPNLGEYHGPIDSTVSVPVSDGQIIFVAPIQDDQRARPGSPLLAWFDVMSDEPATTLPPEAEIYLDELSDQLGFVWNYPVAVYDLSIVDVTQPVNVGDVRNTKMMAGYHLPKHRPSNFNLSDQQAGETDFDNLAEPVRAALRWYSAALIVQPDAQRFVTLWIALEILARHSVEIASSPYVASCGHTIPECPECGRSTERSVEGKRMRSFLSDQMQVERSDVEMLWKVRQLVHGAHRFRPKDVEVMPRATGILWAIVRRAIGAELGLSYESDLVSPFAYSWMAMSGTRPLTEEDLRPGGWAQTPRTKHSIRVELRMTPDMLK